jgi:hypothetical protein
MLQFLPYALAAYGGYQGYKGAKDSGASGLQRILSGALGAYGGYNLGQVGGYAKNAGFGNAASANFVPTFSNLPGVSGLPGMGGVPQTFTGSTTLPGQSGGFTPTPAAEKSSILNILKNKEGGFDPVKTSAAIAAGTYLSGAFDNQPTDVYMPGYNMNYLNLRDQRPQYTYIDPDTGQEKAYEKIYAPEEAGKGDQRMGPYSVNVQRFNTGGLSSIQKFNEGGVNYLPSKVSHDENDANNYVRASGYVEDGAGVGDKDEDTMLAQLADGEFVTRADGVLGAGIIAGANPNSMKDMREKGAQYFYEQQKRYKRVFDLLKDSKNGISKEKAN